MLDSITLARKGAHTLLGSLTTRDVGIVVTTHADTGFSCHKRASSFSTGAS